MDETSSKLIIKKAKIQDAGRYTCRCAFENPERRDEVSTQLYVYGT